MCLCAPPPQTWDSFLKLCFTGKNKTMRSLWGLRVVVTRTQPPEWPADAPWRDRLLAIVDSTGLSAQRANAMSLHEFLSLYRALRAGGAVLLPAGSDSDEDADGAIEDVGARDRPVQAATP